MADIIKNATHEFKWRYNQTDWQLTDISIEIYDGRPYSDVDSDTAYWFHTVKKILINNTFTITRLV